MENSNTYLNGVVGAAIAAASFCFAATAQAQNTPAAGETGPGEEGAIETVIVTGTSQARIDIETPLVATSIDADRLSKLAASGNADILTTVPALKAEGGGGEVATNVFVAGLPGGGQYQFTPLLFNGMPVVASIGLSSSLSSPDLFYRTDLGIERLEFVRGGVSNLFGVGGIGGTINFIDKTGRDTTEGVAQLEVADFNRTRADFAVSGPVSDDLYYALSGFYRYDNGPLDSGFVSDGYQVRGNLRREFETGEVTLYFQAIDDTVQFEGALPLTGTSHELPPGNDGREVTTTQTSALETISFFTPDGLFRTKVGDGVATKGTSAGIGFKKDLGAGWGFNGSWHFGSYDHSFALFAGGDNITNLPTTQAGLLQSYGFDPAQFTGTFTFAENGAAVPANYLLWGDRVIDRERPVRTSTGELNITKDLESGSWNHHFTLGGFFGNTKTSDKNVTYSYIGDFADAPRLVNITVTNNATGAQTIVSRDGLVDAGTAYSNVLAEARRTAVYLADQMEVGDWVLDFGGRYESLEGKVSREGSVTVTTDTTPNLSSRLAQVAWGNGRFLTGEVDPSAWAAAVGALYKLNDRSSVFVNASRGFFMPNLNTVQINATQGVQSFEAEIIKQAQAGYKFAGPRFAGSVAGFYTELTNRRNISFVNSPIPGGGVVEFANLVASRAYGVEATFNVRMFDVLSFESNAVWNHTTYTQFTPVGACTPVTPGSTQSICDGHYPFRQPNVTGNVGFAYQLGNFDASIFDSYIGRAFTNDLNNIEMPAFHVVRLDAGYTLTFAGGDQARLSVNVYNLLDDQAITEGASRQGTLQNAGQAFFVGREILPRRVFVRLNYKF